MTNQLFHFRGYDIPTVLVGKTGGGPETFEKISDWHIAQVQRYIGIRNTDHVLEIGCGIGRDAIPLTKLLTNGSYLGTDTIEPSIQWCIDNISASNPNFSFVHHDIHDSLHNPTGKFSALDIRLPVKQESIDLILLHSVFTHMFADEIVHYMEEFSRVLRPDGRVWASFFIVNEEVLKAISNNPKPGWNLSFRYAWEEGSRVNVQEEPRQAVAYDENTLIRMIEAGGLCLDQSILWGTWTGLRENPRSGQDAIIMRRLDTL